MKPEQYLTELESALEQYRFREVRGLTDQIDPATFDLPQIKKALRLIRRKRLFADLEHAASLFSMTLNELFANPKLNSEITRQLAAGQRSVSISGEDAAKTGEF